jgi:hypothetical protein
MDSNIGLKLHEALCDVKKYEGYVCFVPFTTWNQFQVGFQRNVTSEKRAFMFVITEFMSKVYEYIRTLPERARYINKMIVSLSQVRVYGAEGIGKSAAMYASYCALHGQRDKYRVTSIGDCAAWIVADMPIRFVLNELVQTFYDDILPNLNDSAYPYYERAHEWATWVEKAGLDQEQRLMKFITVLSKYTRDKGLTWFIIIDQPNALYTDKMIKDKGELFLYKKNCRPLCKSSRMLYNFWCFSD